MSCLMGKVTSSPDLGRFPLIRTEPFLSHLLISAEEGFPSLVPSREHGIEGQAIDDFRNSIAFTG